MTLLNKIDPRNVAQVDAVVVEDGVVEVVVAEGDAFNEVVAFSEEVYKNAEVGVEEEAATIRG